MKGFAEQILSWGKWILEKISTILLWIAETIAEKFNFEVKNVYLLLMIGISLYIASLFTEERGLKLLFLASIIFAFLWWIGGI